MALSLAGGMGERDRKFLVAVRRSPQRQDHEPPRRLARLAGCDERVTVLHRLRDRLSPPQRMLRPLEMNLGERDLAGHPVRQVMAEIEHGEADRIFRYLTADLGL